MATMSDKLTGLEKDLAAMKVHKRMQPSKHWNTPEENTRWSLTGRDMRSSSILISSCRIEKLEAAEHNKAVIDKVREELQEGSASLNDWQKMIRLVNSSENGWGAVKEYKGLYESANNEEDSTRWLIN